MWQITHMCCWQGLHAALKQLTTKQWSCWPHAADKIQQKLNTLVRFKGGPPTSPACLKKQQHDDWKAEVFGFFRQAHLCRTQEQGLAYIEKVVVPHLKKHGEDSFVAWVVAEYAGKDQFDWCAFAPCISRAAWHCHS